MWSRQLLSFVNKPREKKPGSNPVQLNRTNNKWCHLAATGDNTHQISLQVCPLVQDQLKLKLHIQKTNPVYRITNTWVRKLPNLHFHSKYCNQLLQFIHWCILITFLVKILAHHPLQSDKDYKSPPSNILIPNVK